MSRHAGLLAATLSMVVATGLANATPSLVDGDWQLNIDCGLSASATNPIQFAEDSASGAITGQFTDPGTFEVPGAIRRVSSGYDVPDPIPGQVSGTDFALPATGFFRSDAIVPAVPLFSCSAATEIISTHRLTGTVTDDGTGRATLIGGTWMNGMVDARDATGVTCWSVTPVPSCSFDMRRNDLAVGDNVSVSPRDKTTVTFEHVISPGTVEVEPLTEATGTVPENFEVLGSGGVPIFYDVRTTATFVGTVTSCFPYPDANGDGIVDGTNPPLDETDLRVLHEENGVFVDRTVSLDTTKKIICGATTSLSQLAVAHPPAPPRRDYSVGGKLILLRKRSGREIGHFTGAFVAPALSTGANPDDPREAGAGIDLFSTDQTITRVVMPSAGWVAGHHARVFRFVSSLAARGPSPVTLAVLRAHAVQYHYSPAVEWEGNLSVQTQALRFALDTSAPAVGVRVTLGAFRYCDIFQNVHHDSTKNKLIIGASGVPPLDCADKRMWWSLNRVR